MGGASQEAWRLVGVVWVGDSWHVVIPETGANQFANASVDGMHRRWRGFGWVVPDVLILRLVGMIPAMNDQPLGIHFLHRAFGRLEARRKCTSERTDAGYRNMRRSRRGIEARHPRRHGRWGWTLIMLAVCVAMDGTHPTVARVGKVLS